MLKKTYYLLIIAITFFSCNDKKPSFDFESWQKDECACTNNRAELLDEYNKLDDYLINKSGKQIIELLGKPDITELNKRHIKTYIYFIDPYREKCPNSNNMLSRASCIELNSIGKVSVISQQLR